MSVNQGKDVKGWQSNKSKVVRVPWHHVFSFSSYEAKSRSRKGLARHTREPEFHSKKEFLQANCRIFVSHASLERDSINNSFDWPNVERVDIIYPHDSEPRCSICLEETPAVPQITKCGHVFCWHCILKYIGIDGKHRSWAKCPLCLECICKKDLRSARFQLVEPLKSMGTIDLCLVSRKRGQSLVTFTKPLQEALAVSSPSRLVEDGSFPNEFSLGIQFAKLAILYRPDIMWRKERACLYKIREDCNELQDMAGVAAAEEAIEYLQERLKDYKSDPLVEEEANKSSVRCLSYVDYDLQNFIPYTESLSSSLKEKEEKKSTIGDTSVVEPYSRKAANSNDSDRDYTFYQSVDGQLCYLQPFLFKCLMYEYKTTDKLPHILSNLKLLHVEYAFSSSSNTRYAFLDHLPQATQVAFVQVDIEHLLSDATKLHFQSEFARRLKLRKEAETRSKLEEREYHKRFSERYDRDYSPKSFSTDSISPPPTPIPILTDIAFPSLQPLSSPVREVEPFVEGKEYYVSKEDEDLKKSECGSNVAPASKPSPTFLEVLKMQPKVIAGDVIPMCSLNDQKAAAVTESSSQNAARSSLSNKIDFSKWKPLNTRASAQNSVVSVSQSESDEEFYDASKSRSSYSLGEILHLQELKCKQSASRHEKIRNKKRM